MAAADERAGEKYIEQGLQRIQETCTALTICLTMIKVLRLLFSAAIGTSLSAEVDDLWILAMCSCLHHGIHLDEMIFTLLSFSPVRTGKALRTFPLHFRVRLALGGLCFVTISTLAVHAEGLTLDAIGHTHDNINSMLLFFYVSSVSFWVIDAHFEKSSTPVKAATVEYTVGRAVGYFMLLTGITALCESFVARGRPHFIFFKYCDFLFIFRCIQVMLDLLDRLGRNMGLDLCSGYTLTTGPVHALAV